MTYPQEILDIAKRTHCPPETVAETRALSPSALKELVDAYVLEAGDGPASRRLQPARDLAEPYLIAVFERDNPFEINASCPAFGATPARQALMLLGGCFHPELKRQLLRWLRLRSDDPKVLRTICGRLVDFGSDDLLPDVAMLFEHADYLISMSARGSALSAGKDGRAEPEFRRYVSELCLRLLRQENPPEGFDPIRVLVALHGEAAAKMLADPKDLDPDHPLFIKTLVTLNHLGCPPDAGFLNALLADSSLSSPERRDGIWRAALEGLVVLKDPSASVYVEWILGNPALFSQLMTIIAWQARFRLRGWKSLVEEITYRTETSGIELEDFPPDLYDIAVIDQLHGGVLHYGFWYWFDQAFGGEFGRAGHQALVRIGATEHAKIVAQVNDLFGPAGPPVIPEEMEPALAALPDGAADLMEEMDRQWQELPEWTLSAYAWEWHRRTGGE
jgi:hypothetical protein